MACRLHPPYQTGQGNPVVNRTGHGGAAHRRPSQRQISPTALSSLHPPTGVRANHAEPRMKVLWCWRCRIDIPMLEDFEVELVWGANSAAREDPDRYRESTGGLVDVELELFRAACTAAQAKLESYRASTAPSQNKEWESEMEVEVARREFWSWQHSGTWTPGHHCQVRQMNSRSRYAKVGSRASV